MSIVSVVNQPTGLTLKLGRNVPRVIHPHLHLRNYLLKSLPSPPAAVDYSGPAKAWLANVLLNDQLGDCLDAASFHVGGTLLANAGEPIPFTTSDVSAFYSGSAGYVPGNASTDQGGTWQATLAYWQSNGLTPQQHQIEGYAGVDATDPEEVQTAVWLFENVDIGMSLPKEWVAMMQTLQNGFVWDVAGDPDPENGHAVCSVTSDESGLTIDSWGIIGKMTWPAVAKYCIPANQGEMYTVFSRDAINSAMGVAPSGFDFTALQADLHMLSMPHRHHHPSPQKPSPRPK